MAHAPSLLRTVGWCWPRPRLLCIELTWRWLCGALLLVLFGAEALRIAAATGPAVQATGLLNANLESAVQDPAALSLAFSNALAILKPWLSHATLGLAPLALFAWVSAFALGRAALLRRYDSALPSRAWLLAVCEGARLLGLLGLSSLWYATAGWSARYALGSGSDGAEPNLVLYCMLVICASAVFFIAWSLLSWALMAAPLLAMLEHATFLGGLRRSIGLRRVRGKLVEVNLAMAVIKLGLVVLAMVFSATPLPFDSVMQGWPLTAWWVVVTLLYLAASDFFKMAQFFVFLEYLRPAPAPHQQALLETATLR
jgi:hypothetical protein